MTIVASPRLPAPTPTRRRRRSETDGTLTLLGDVEAGTVVRLLDGSYGIVMFSEHAPRWAVAVDFWDEPAALVDRSELVYAYPSP